MIKVLELFAGYGSQALALKRLGLEFESRISEIDKYAIQAYNLIHGETFNYGDICQIDEKKLPYFDLITYSSPCQDFSIAGKQRGGGKIQALAPLCFGSVKGLFGRSSRSIC